MTHIADAEHVAAKSRGWQRQPRTRRPLARTGSKKVLLQQRYPAAATALPRLRRSKDRWPSAFTGRNNRSA